MVKKPDIKSTKEIIPINRVIDVSKDTVVDGVNNRDRDRDLKLELAGLTPDVLFRTVADGLRAETVLVSAEGVEVGREPDHTIRAKFASVAMDILGEKKVVVSTGSMPLMNIFLPNGTKLQVGGSCE